MRECPQCLSLVRAEEGLVRDLTAVRETELSRDLTLDAVRLKTEELVSRDDRGKESRRSPLRRLISVARPRTKLGFAAVAVAVVLGLLTLVPFNFREQIGYQIAIDGVEKNVAMDNQKIASLLGALGMQQDKATNLLDSLGINQIRFSVGECTQTCKLTISDLKTERDVQLMVKAIVELGCCRIDDIVPIFRNESTSLLRLAARKLLS